MKTPLWIALGLLPMVAACGDDPPPAPIEHAGQTCTNASQCYPNVDGGALKGEVICMEKVTNGYCTHKCTSDQDCCAVPGECVSGHPQVCSPYENQPDQYCLLSCEPNDIGSVNGDSYCSTWAHPGFKCRSSGGGTANRKVCTP
jgi:hypothetical protein